METKFEEGDWTLTQEVLDEPPVRMFLNQYVMEKKKWPPLDVPGCKKKKLAICGLATTSRMLAPFQDPAFDIWSCHAGFKVLPRVDVTFEIHDPTVFGTHPEQFEKAYYEDLQKLQTPIFMQKHYDEIPNSIPYPIDEIVAQFGRFNTNTIEYMVWLAIRQGYEQVGLFGVEMEHGTEYIDQGRGVLYSLGILQGRGIGLYIPDNCQLFKCRWMYGFETAQRDLDTERIEKFKAEMNSELSNAQNQLNSSLAHFHEVKGRVDACDIINRRILKVD
jgi:hypothetical protein